MKRIFFALTLDEMVKVELGKVQEKVRPMVKKGKFVPPSMFHLTLQFLGELEEVEVYHLKELQFQWLKRFDTVMLNIDHLGCFQKGNRWILWAGVNKNPVLDQLADLLQSTMSQRGYDYHLPFNPHITLAREVLFNNEDAQLAYATMPVSVSSLNVNGFHLMESTRDEGRLQYNSLKKFCFDE